jgi:xylan 1,4-beta-xylosidase
VYTNDHVRMGIANHLRTVEDGFRIVKAYPELQNTPVVIGESDPEGCAACQGPQLGYRNGTMYSSYTAASFARILELAQRNEVNLDAALTWAFTFENQPLFAGFRQVATGGIDLPVLNVFRMFSRMGGRQLSVTSDGAISLDEIKREGVRKRPDVSALASLGEKRLTILLWHYHDDDQPGAMAEVHLKVAGVPSGVGAARLTRFAIDEEHGNAFAAWRRMGSPAELSSEDYARLEAAGRLALLGAPERLALREGKFDLGVPLRRQAVMLLLFEWD